MDKVKKVAIIDQTSEGDHHMVFNTALIKIMAIINPNNQLNYYGTPSNIRSVKQLMHEEEISKIHFNEIIYSYKPKSIILKIFNYGLKELKRLNNFYAILNRNSKNDLIVLSITTFTSFLGFKILKMFYSTPTISVLHGDVDFVYNSDNLLSKINGLTHQLIFKIPARNFKYLTLNKIEKKFLVKDGYLRDEEVFEIEHPFLNMKSSETTRCLQLPLNLGHIGSMEVERKNSHFIFELAESCKDLIFSDKVVFKSIGLMTPGVTPYKNKLVQMAVGNESDISPKYLSRQAYEEELDMLNYILFFYPKTEYIFRASGAVVDFLAKNKPIICLKHPLFEYMFEKAGNIGFICNDLYEMKNLIEQLTSQDYDLDRVYHEQVDNIKKYKENFKVEEVANDLKSQMG